MSYPTPVDVCICTRNRADELIHALRSVIANDYPRFSVTIVDQSDGDDTRAVVAQCRAEAGERVPVRYIPTDTRGISHARNILLTETTEPLIAFTDDDCLVPENWVSTLAALFGADTGAMMIYGQVFMPDEFKGDRSVSVPCLYFDTRRELPKGDIFGMGANMAMRRTVPDAIGLYDLILGAGGTFGGGEDFDFLYRAQSAGLKAVAEPSLTVIHKSFRTSERWAQVAYAYGRGDAAFYNKHARCGDRWAQNVIRTRLAGYIAKNVVKTVIGRGKTADWSYLRGFRDGLKQSAAIPVDVERRMYRVEAATP